MGIDSKYGRVTTEFANIPEDEPVMLFRAQDRLALSVISHYFELCLGNGNVGGDHLDAVARQLKAFVDWQKDNAHATKTPDTVPA